MRELEELGTIILGLNGRTLQCSREHQMLAEGFLLFRVEVRIALNDNLGDERLREDLCDFAGGQCLFEDVGIEEGRLEFGQVVLYDRLYPLGRFLEALDV